MITRLVFFAATLLIVAACSRAPEEQPLPPLDVILSGGTVYNGADEAPVVADVGIIGDRIYAVGDLGGRTAKLTLDVSGLAVSPGFVDIHSHAVRDDPEDGIFRWPDSENLIRQGVTTVVGGPDGSSPLPIEDTLRRLEENPVAVNFATFVGHGSVRGLVVGPDDREATDAEMQQMRETVANAMEEGAFGLSSGLIYAPGSFAPTEEVVELAKVAAGYGGIYISHMRQEGLDILKSIEETIHIGEAGGLPTQITHHKIVGAPMWGASEDTLAMVDAALARGVDVSIDQYPYTASSTSLTILFPRWSLDGDRETRLRRLRNPDDRVRIKAAVANNIKVDRGGNDPANVALSSCRHDNSLNGFNLSQVLQKQERQVTIENAADLLIELVEAGNCSAVFHAMNEQDVEKIMQHPVTMVASDGGVEAPSERVPHPRNYGTFARVLGHYVRERGTLPLHTAIYKMARLPADRIGLSDRGRIEEGAIADIAVFNPDAVIDHATFENPHQYAEGLHHVFVAGEAALLDGSMSGALPGRVLRSADY
jgi:N-acyl-D-amino-acid deacylase